MRKDEILKLEKVERILKFDEAVKNDEVLEKIEEFFTDYFQVDIYSLMNKWTPVATTSKIGGAAVPSNMLPDNMLDDIAFRGKSGVVFIHTEEPTPLTAVLTKSFKLKKINLNTEDVVKGYAEAAIRESSLNITKLFNVVKSMITDEIADNGLTSRVEKALDVFREKYEDGE